MTNILRLIGTFLLALSATVQACIDTIPATTPDDRFVVIGNEVIDKETMLIWQRCSLGQTENDCRGGYANTYIWKDALQAAETERVATGKAWRLPNLNELESILEEKCDDPAINQVIFPKTIYSSYWTASTSTGIGATAWRVEFQNGFSYTTLKSGEGYVRLVRNGQ